LRANKSWFTRDFESSDTRVVAMFGVINRTRKPAPSAEEAKDASQLRPNNSANGDIEDYRLEKPSRKADSIPASDLNRIRLRTKTKTKKQFCNLQSASLTEEESEKMFPSGSPGTCARRFIFSRPSEIKYFGDNCAN
jgi:hypothetical protein